MASSTSLHQTLGDLNTDNFVSLLSKLIGESKYVQNNPPELIPEEDRIVNHVLKILIPYSTTTGGGPLIVNHVTYKPKRGNLIVEYPGTQPDKILSFVGMHMDVVPANPDDWNFDPFSLSTDGDKLRGRGTTDCLGHVALVAELMRRLGETKPKLKSTVVAVFIASEENSSIPGVGVDELVKHGLLNKLKQGPLYWIDTADKQPCIGTGGVIPWKLHVTGKLFHSGLPHKAINPMELAMEALKVIQSRFYKDFPPHPKEQVYGFATPSTMKPTQWSYPGGGNNQIPGECTVSGDVRLTPFYDILDVIKKLQDYVEELNTNIEMETVFAAEGLALTLHSVGSLREAQELLERCLDARKMLLSKDHIQIAGNLLHIARVVLLNSSQLKKTCGSEAIVELNKAKNLLHESIRIARHVLDKLMRDGKKQSKAISRETLKDGPAALMILLQSHNTLGQLEITMMGMPGHEGDHTLVLNAEKAFNQCISVFKEYGTWKSLPNSSEAKAEYLSCLRQLSALLMDHKDDTERRSTLTSLQELKDEINSVEGELQFKRR